MPAGGDGRLAGASRQCVEDGLTVELRFQLRIRVAVVQTSLGAGIEAAGTAVSMSAALPLGGHAPMVVGMSGSP